jgi:3'(2'), 5'-bisphosphate nucleotidase
MAPSRRHGLPARQVTARQVTASFGRILYRVAANEEADMDGSGADQRGDAAAWRQLLDDLTTLVSRAGAVILSHPPTQILFKPDKSPVTAADRAAEAAILDGLAQLAPGIPVLAEESASRGMTQHPAGDYFLVDPLDGTREFIAGRGEYTVNIALMRDGTPLLGLVAAPAMGTIWRAGAVGGAERLSLPAGEAMTAAVERMPLRTRRAPERDLTALVSRSHLDADTSALLGHLSVKERVACGSAIKFCRLAEGAADIYPRLAPTSLWDVAAGHAVLAKAGGAVTRPDGAPLRYGADDLRIPGFIAWGDAQAAVRFARA